MTKKRNYYTASKKSKIALAAIEGKLTQAQLTSGFCRKKLSDRIRSSFFLWTINNAQFQVATF